MERINYTNIQKWAQEYSTDPEIPTDWLLAIARIESSLNPNAISPRGAMGLFQFMPITLLDLKIRYNYMFSPFDPKQSTIAAKIYLSWLLRVLEVENMDESIRSVLIAYNWGIGNLRKYQRGEIDSLPQETINYIDKFFDELRKIENEKF